MEVLTKYCRVCAKPLARFKVSYKCADRSDVLERTFGVAVEDDNPDTQLLSFCHSCTKCGCVHRRQRRKIGCTLPLYSCLLGVHTQSIAVLSVTILRNIEWWASEKAGDRSSINHQHTFSHRTPVHHRSTKFVCPVNLHSPVVHSCTSSVSIDDLVCHLCSFVVDRPIHLMTCNRLCMSSLCTSLREKGFCCPV